MSANTTETTTAQTENDAWTDADLEETTEFFRATIANWRCENCGTEFSVQSVFDRARRLGHSVSCPMCDDGESLTRRHGGDL